MDSITHSQVVYGGRRQSKKGTLIYVYQTLREDGRPTPERFTTAKPLLGGASIGAILQLTHPGDDRTKHWVSGEHAPVAVGQYTHEEDLIFWAAEDKAAVMLRTRELETQRVLKAGSDPLRERLDPIREQLAGMQIDRRAVTVAWIMDYLLTGTVRTR